MDLNRHREGSEAFDISHLVEGMKDEHVSDSPDRSADKGVDQAPEMMNSKLSEFRQILDTKDIDAQENIDELNSIIAEVAKEDRAQAETLKEEWVAKKIESAPEIE